jgi:hypothetical protein
MGKSVVFIEPTGHVSNVFENYMRLPLMGSLYLGTILHNHGYHVRILNENILGSEIDPFEIQADVFCLTALTVSAGRANLLAEAAHRPYCLASSSRKTRSCSCTAPRSSNTASQPSRICWAT